MPEKVNTLMNTWLSYEYYQLNVELYQIKLQVILELRQDDLAEAVYNEYKAYLEAITTVSQMKIKKTILP
jgi:hypothetical protein